MPARGKKKRRKGKGNKADSLSKSPISSWSRLKQKQNPEYFNHSSSQWTQITRKAEGGAWTMYIHRYTYRYRNRYISPGQ